MTVERLWRSTAVILLLGVSVPIAAQNEQKQTKRDARAEAAAGLPVVLVPDQNDQDPATLDLYYGIGGKDDAPDPNGTYTFVDEDLKQTSPKFDVVDAQGERWRVKLGAEPQAETAATRLVWAAGYFVDEDYYVADLQVRGLPRLHRGQQYVTEGGVVHGARLERRPKSVKELGDWSWFDNPFVNTREFNGLRMMMSLINNWDLAQDNNAIYEQDGERRYVVKDLGASFGNTGNYVARSKSNLDDYARSKFIVRVTADDVDFVMHDRPLFLEVFDIPYYLDHSRMQGITRNIPRADAKWMGERLGRLSESQIRDCFKAAGYSAEEVDGFTKAVQKRIAAINDI